MNVLYCKCVNYYYKTSVCVNDIETKLAKHIEIAYINWIVYNFYFSSAFECHSS